MKAGKFVTVLALLISGASAFGLGGHAYAAAPATPGKVLTIIPTCVSVSQNIGLFTVTNENADAVQLGFSNPTATAVQASYPAVGTFTAQPGTSSLYVAYNSSDPNNTTSFVDPNASSVESTNMHVDVSCDAGQLPGKGQGGGSTPTPAPLCTDGSNASNLIVLWNGDSQISIATKTGLPLCDDISLYYSTYRMPDTYDGRGFYPDNSGVANSTAYPQTLLQSYNFTLTKGTYGSWLENVPTPDYCYNVQADLYYAPEVTTVGANGHGSQNIASQIFTRDASKCAPGKGAGTGTTSTTPTVLPDTGVENLGSNVLGSLLTLAFGATSMLALGVRALRQY